MEPAYKWIVDAKVCGTCAHYRQQYYKYEKGIQEIPAHHLIVLADYYHVTVDYLLGRET